MFLLLASIARGSVVDRVVAVAGSEVVLASDIALDVELSAVDPSPSPFWSRPVERRQIEAAILRTAAGDIALYQPSDDAVRARLGALRTAVVEREPWAVFLGRWGLDDAALAAVIRRRLLVEAYLARNVQVPPGDPTWQWATDALVGQLAGRVRVREVPCEGCSPPEERPR